MNEIKCIYCGMNEKDGVDLSYSDIIPDGLTKRKVGARNVCRIKHNNDFGSSFETEVITALSPIRNYLNIKNKQKKFPSYPVSIQITDQTYMINTQTLTPIFGTGIVTSTDNKSKIGPLNQIKKISKNGEITIIDNLSDVSSSFSIDTSIFFSENMYRLIAKISYEWFCKVNKINLNLPAFEEIRNLIINGLNDHNQNLVSLCSSNNLNQEVRKLSNFGEHYLLCYTVNNDIMIFYSLLGIASYTVKLGQSSLYSQFKNNYYLHLTDDNEYTGDVNDFELISKQYETRAISLSHKIKGIPITSKLDGIKFMKAINVIQLINILHSNENNIERFIKIVHSNLEDMYKEKNIDKALLKRFVTENQLTDSPITLKDTEDDEYWFLMHIIFNIGTLSKQKISMKDISKIINPLIEDKQSNKIQIYQKGSSFKRTIKGSSTNLELITQGAKKILNL